MASPRAARTYRRATGVFGVVVVGLGLTMIGLALAGGGGPLSVGVLMGSLFILLGVSRIYLLRKGR